MAVFDDHQTAFEPWAYDALQRLRHTGRGFARADRHHAIESTQIILRCADLKAVARSSNRSRHGPRRIGRLQSRPDDAPEQRTGGRRGQREWHRGYGVLSCLKQRLGQVWRGTRI